MDTTPMRTMTVSVTITAQVQVPAHLMGDHVPKRLHNWSGQVLEVCERGWSEKTGVDRKWVSGDGIVEIDAGDGPDPSTG